jgi:hypothetical protein
MIASVHPYLFSRESPKNPYCSAGMNRRES